MSIHYQIKQWHNETMYWRIQGSISFIIMQISAIVLLNNRFSIQTQGLAPAPPPLPRVWEILDQPLQCVGFHAFLCNSDASVCIMTRTYLVVTSVVITTHKRLPMKLRDVFTSVCLSVYGIAFHVTITHGALDLTVQGPSPRHQTWNQPLPCLRLLVISPLGFKGRVDSHIPTW